MNDDRRVGGLLTRVARGRTRGHVRYVATVAPGRARGLVAQVYAQLERDFGVLAPPVILHTPAPATLAAAWLMLRESMLARGLVPRPVKEAVAVAVSRANACPYCVDVHSIALHGLIRSTDAGAVAGDGAAAVGDRELSRVVDWALSGGADPSAPRAFPTRQAPELVGTAVTFHYLNRMVNLFLVESPIPVRPRRVVARLAGALLRPMLEHRTEPGGSLDLLPPAPPSTGTRVRMPWAEGSPVVDEAFARAAGAVEAAGRRSVPAPVRALVAARLDSWDGQPPGLSGAWLDEAVADLLPHDRPPARLALLAALASYQAGPSVVEQFRSYRPDDRSLVEVASWGSMQAALRIGRSLWREPDQG